MKRALLAVAALLAILIGVAVWSVESGWIQRRVQARIVGEIESTTGGRVTLGGFNFDWRTRRAALRDIVIHGLEPAGERPFFQARRIEVGLAVISFWQRKLELISLDADAPQVNVLVGRDGRTNVPEPRVRREKTGALPDRFLDLSIGQYHITRGEFHLGQRQWPLEARGKDLDVRLDFDRAARAYSGTVRAKEVRIVQPLRAPLQFNLESDVRIEPNRITFSKADFRTGRSAIKASAGEIALDRQFASAQLEGVVSIEQLGPLLNLPIDHRGEARVVGLFQWKGGYNWTAAGSARGSGIGYHAGKVQVNGMTGRATFRATANQLDLLGIRLQALGGEFRGKASVTRNAGYTAAGDVENFALSRLTALGWKNPLPWEATVSGPVKVSGPQLAAEGTLKIEGAADAPLVRGELTGVLLAGGQLRVEPSFLEFGGTRINVAGDLAKRVDFGFTSRQLDDLLPLLASAGIQLGEAPIKILQGIAQFDGSVTGSLEQPQITGRLRAGPLQVQDRRVESVNFALDASASEVRITELRWKESAFDLQGYATLGLAQWRPAPDAPIAAKLTLVNAPIEPLLASAKLAFPIEGELDAQVDIQGTTAAPRVTSRVTAAPLEAWGERFDRFEADVRYAGERLEISNGRLLDKGSALEFSASHAQSVLRLEFSARNSRLALWEQAQRLQPQLDAAIVAKGVITARTPPGGQPVLTSADAEVKLQGVTLSGRRFGDLALLVRTKGRVMTADLTAQVRESRLQGVAEWSIGGAANGLGQFTVSNLTFSDLYDLFADPGQKPSLRGVMNGELGFSGPILRPELWNGYAKINTLEVEPITPRFEAAGRRALVLRNKEPILASIDSKGITLQSAHLAAEGTDLEASGAVSIRSKNPWNLRLRGNLSLPVLTIFEPDLVAKGTSTLDATIRGTLERPNIVGRMELKQAELNFRGLPNGVENANGVIVFDRTRANIERLTAQSGGGDLALTGFVDFGGDQFVYRLGANVQRVRVRYPEDVSTTFDASLNWTGTTAQSVLGGTITLNKMGINPKTDLGSLLESTGRSSSSPVTSSAVMRGLQLDIRVQTSPDAELQTSLARDIAPQAELRLRGSGARPVLFGRVSVNQGEIQFFGNRYTITRGDISFFNPVRIEPVIDLDLETKVRGITVNMNFSGPVSKLNASYRSDPPLQSTEIIALLTVGRTPGTGITPSLQQSQSLQSMTGNNTLLGQAISAPINSRLQRLFGVSRIKIDPDLSSVTNTPQARLTVEQQLSRDLTVTYITNLNRTQQQIVRVQWDFSRDFSVLAVRDENGIFGVDFLWRKRF